MKKNKLIFVAIILSMSALTIYADQSEVDKTEAALSGAQTALQQLYDDGSIVFKMPGNETTFVKAMMQLQAAATAIANFKQTDETAAKLDGILEEARTVQKILAAYLGEKNFFNSYYLKKGKIDLRVDATAVYEQIIKKLPFLGNISIGGSIHLDPGKQIVSQFNALKTEFYGLLVEAAHFDATDSRIKSLAKWGNGIKVIYPGERDSFGEEIITTQQIWELHLPMGF